MKLYCLLICFCFVNGFGQDFKVGKEIKIPNSFETIPLAINNSYAITYFPKKPTSLPYLNSFTSVGHVTFRYSKKFTLTKHNLSDLTKYEKEFSISKKNNFNGFCSTTNNLLIVSQNKTENSVSYFLDLIDYDQMEVKVENKEIIKFKDGEKRKIIYFKEGRDGFDIIFKKYALVNNNYVLEYFTLGNDFSVNNFIEIPINSENAKWVFSSSVREKKLNLFFDNTITYGDDSTFYNTFGLLKIAKDTFEFNEYSMPKNRFIEGFNVIDRDENLRVVTLLSNKSRIAEYIYIWEGHCGQCSIKIAK